MQKIKVDIKDRKKDITELSNFIPNKKFLSDVSIEINKTNVLFSFDSIDYFSAKKDLKVFNGNRIIKDFVKELESIKSYGLRNGKRIYTGYNKERKTKNRKEKVKKRLAYEYFSKSFSKKNNPCPEKHINKIINTDSEKFLKKLPDNCIDVIFTSPPYNFGLDYGKYDDAHIWNNYFKKLFVILDECTRVLKYGGRLIINIQPLFSDYMPSHHIISSHLFKNGLIWKGELLWDKNNYNCKYTAWGSWKSPSSPYLKYTWEFLEIFCKGNLKKEGDNSNIDISGDEFKKWVNAKWNIAPEREMKKYKHPAMFPEKLAERIIKLFSYQNDIILDPFNGAGTTTAVAKKYFRKYIGIDTSKDYCKIAEKRIKDLGGLF